MRCSCSTSPGGESTGDWRRQSFDDRGEEAIAAARALAERTDIDAARVGLIGHSQGGWIAQVAAARNPDEVAFLILLAGPSISVQQQIQDDVESGWTCRGFSALHRSARRAGLRLGLSTLAGTARVVTPGYLSRIIHYDPRSDLPHIGQPTLALFAENDPLVIPGTNLARLHRFFGVAQRNDRLAIATIPGADHFFRTASRCPTGARVSRWAPEFFEAFAHEEYWRWVAGSTDDTP